MILSVILMFILIISVITDIRERRILNIVTFPTILFGLIFHTLNSGLNGFIFSSLGLLLGIALLFIPYALGGMGAGDVKLLGAVGALQGSLFVFQAFLYTCIAGALFATIVLLKRKQFFARFKNMMNVIAIAKSNPTYLNQLDKKDLSHSIPYGVAICMGTVFTLVRGGMI
ncbi:hypothetical protein BKP35_01315 [Anaerobacillus arseniciselenatis]|uniref:Prepilin type IV endopeptidase peptidase domain-containing protein n=1 Tax=Anaerobacillus arseniciselenatis TaxID=85682 RepID=A0A1S2LU39_9BACI|nr:prepilin peptidase [Anaerobacillus arseniciselenatis]OIJ15663.1 hypothetical protein BKP35_01315 [Anaerobacillus arseniciselenatis]